MDEILKKMRGPNSIKLCTKLAQYTLEPRVHRPTAISIFSQF